MNVSEEVETIKLARDVTKRVTNNVFQYSICSMITEGIQQENDFSSLTSQEIIDKIRDHLKGEPSDVDSLIFLRYLASFPVSICKRDVSPLLKRMISTHYLLGAKLEYLSKLYQTEPITYDDVALIFGRSKATINAYVNETKDLFDSCQDQVIKEGEKKDSIEEGETNR